LTAEALVLLAVGLPFASGNLLLKKAFFALEDTKTPVKVAGISVASYLVVGYLGMRVLGIGGLALGLALTEVLYFVILWTLLHKKTGGIPSRDLVVLVGKILVCAACMGAVVGWLRLAIPPAPDFGTRLAALLIEVGAGLAVYGLCALVLIRNELRGIRRLFQKQPAHQKPDSNP
jgi:putative peptidoglycan lipid II flippase